MNNMEVTFTIKMNAQEVQRAIESGILAQLAQGAIAQEELDTVRRVEDKPVGETPAAEAKSATTPAPAPVPKAAASEVAEQYETPSASIEAVRKALIPLIEAGKQAQVQELFQRFGGSKLSDIPEDKLGELLAAAEELTA